MLATHDHTDFSLEALLDSKPGMVTVVIPTRETAGTIARTVEQVLPLIDAGLVDQLLVVDADSEDGTAEIAAAAGAEVVSESSLVPEHGPVLGKGDAMWRAQQAIVGEVVVFTDGDVADFGPHYVLGPLGPLFADGRVSFAKGFYRRPFRAGAEEMPAGGGRVTELVAKPLLQLTAPELAAFEQPLSGEFAIRSDLLASIPIHTGYGVEMGMLVSIWDLVGIRGMAQVDLESKRNAHQDLEALRSMSLDVMGALAHALVEADRPDLGALMKAAGAGEGLVVRPPWRSVESGALPDEAGSNQ